MVGFAVELGELDFEVGTHRPHDLFHAGEVPVSENLVPVLRDEDQVCVQHENAVPAGADALHVDHKPTWYSGFVAANSARRYRAYPSPEQADRLTGWAHTCRAVWNAALEQRQFLWSQRRQTMRAGEQCAELTVARAELPWMADLPAQCAQQVLRAVDRAYDNWWNPNHPAGGPTRKKRGGRMAVSFPGQAVRVEKVNGRWARVRLPKLGWVRFRLSRPVGGAVRNVTVSLDALGWHVSFGVDVDSPAVAPNGLPGCGVDFAGGGVGVRLRRDHRPVHATHPVHGGAGPAAGVGTDEGPAGPVGEAPQRRPVLPAAGPHHRENRRIAGAAGTAPPRLHAQAHHRSGQKPRLGRSRRAERDRHDPHCPGNRGGPREPGGAESRPEPGDPRQHPRRTPPAVGVQGAAVRVAGPAGTGATDLPAVQLVRDGRPEEPARVRAGVHLHHLRARRPRGPQRRNQHL